MKAEAGVEQPLLQPADAVFDALPAEPHGCRSALVRVSLARERGRLSHALLLAGPSGCGKRVLAVRLAQRARCTAPVQGPEGVALACGRCASCGRVERGLDPDVHVLEPPWDAKKGEAKGEIPVEQVRRLQERLTFRSAGASRFVLVDPADRLSAVAQEAMLKTLEEPPSGVTLLLATTRPSALKPTVRSRCQTVRIAAPSRAAIAAAVMSLTQASEARGRVVADLCGGDARRAMEIDPDEAAQRCLELARSLYALLGAQGESRARELAVAAAGGGDDAGGGRRAELEAWLDLLERLLRDVMVAGVAGAADGSASLLAHAGGDKARDALVAKLPPERAARALVEVARVRDDLALHANAKVALTHLLLMIHGLRADLGR